MPGQGRTRTSRFLPVTGAEATLVTLIGALTAFYCGGLTVQGKNPQLRKEQFIAASRNTAQAGSHSDATNTSQLPKDPPQQQERASDLEIPFDNSSDAPLVITAASVHVKTYFVEVRKPVSDPKLPRGRYIISPNVVLQSVSKRPITGFVLRFVWAGSISDKACSGEGQLNLTTGADYRFKMEPRWEGFTLEGDPNLLRVTVAAVLLEGEDLWVNLDRTGRRPEATRGTSSDKETASAPSRTAPRPPGEAEKRARRVTDVTIIGYLLGMVTALGDSIGLPLVFEESAGVRIQWAGDFYLRNLRYGDHLEIILRLANLKYTRIGNSLTVTLDASPGRLQRLMLAN